MTSLPTHADTTTTERTARNPNSKALTVGVTSPTTAQPGTRGTAAMAITPPNSGIGSG
jgi:hypothetical protein